MEDQHVKEGLFGLVVLVVFLVGLFNDLQNALLNEQEHRSRRPFEHFEEKACDLFEMLKFCGVDEHVEHQFVKNFEYFEVPLFKFGHSSLFLPIESGV